MTPWWDRATIYPAGRFARFYNIKSDLPIDELRGIARASDEAGHVPKDLLDKVWELTLVNSAIPEAYGGGELDRSPVTNALILEELGHGCVSLASAAMGSSLFIHPLLDIAKRTDGSVSARVPVLNVQGIGYMDGFLAVVVARVAKGVPSVFATAWEGDTRLWELKGVVFPVPAKGAFSRVAFPKVEEYGAPVGFVVAEHGKRVWVYRTKAGGASEVLAYGTAVKLG